MTNTRLRGARRAAASLTLALLTSTVLGGNAQAATFTVTDQASLIAAINNANASPGTDTILLFNDISLTSALPQITDLATINFQGYDLTASSGGTLKFNAGGTLIVPTGSAFSPGFGIGVTGTGSGVLTVVNQGAITSFGDAINGSVKLDVNNSGTVQSTGYAGVYAFGGGTIVNSGSIQGGSDSANGYGVVLGGDGAVLTNQNGGSISGAAGGVSIFNPGNATLNLEVGSTTDDIDVVQGGVTANIAGAVTGDFDASGSSSASTVNLTGGSIEDVRFGSGGGNVLNWTGGTIGGVVAGGNSLATFNVDHGAGTTATLAGVSNVFGSVRSGILVLNSQSGSNGAWDIGTDATLAIDGTVASSGGTFAGLYANGASVAILSGSSLTLGDAGINASGGSALNPTGIYNSGTYISSADYGGFTGPGFTFYSYGVNNSGTMLVLNYGSIQTGDHDYTAAIWNAGNIVVNNNGTIQGGADGSTKAAYAIVSDGGTVMVDNGGVIAGADAAIKTTGGSLVLNNYGIVVGMGGGVIASGSVDIVNYADSAIGTGFHSGNTYVAYGTTGNAITAGSGTITNFGDINGNGFGVDASGTMSITNSGTISGAANDGILAQAGLTLDNQGGQITGYAFGVETGGVADITNSGTIEGGNSGIFALDAATIRNSGTIVGHGSTGANGDGISASSTLNLTNSGTIQGDLNAGVVAFNGGLTVDNRAGGTISGGAGFYGIAVNSAGTLNLTNGGTLSAGSGSDVAIMSAGDSTMKLLSGSTVNGDIVWTGSGTNVLTIGGAVSGSYDGSFGGGNNDVTLAATGSINAIQFGDGNDRFVDGGGSYGSIDTGLGIDTYAVSSSVNGTFDLSSVVAGFDQFQKLGSNTVTLTGIGANGNMDILAGDGGNNDGSLVFGSATTDLTGDIYVNGTVIRANAAGAFGTGTIHMIDPTIQYAASGTYANNIALEVASPASADPSRLEAINGSTATLTGVIATGSTPTTDPTQYVTIGGNGTIVLTNTANSWTGVTRIDPGATLRGASNTISGGSIVDNGTLNYVQSYSGTVAQNISGTGRVGVSGLAAGNTLTFAGNLTNGGINLTDGSHIALTGTSTTSGNGVNVTGANAIVDVANNASLTSNSGPAINSVAANTTVNNLGTISGNGASPVGVGLYAGGTINNGSATDAVASILGANSGSNNGGSVTLNNYGLVRGNLYNGIDGNALTVNNLGGGQIVGVGAAGGSAGYGVQAQTLTATNAGQIVGRYAGISVNGAINLTNSGLIGSGTLSGTTFSYSSGNDGVQAINGGTINNLSGGQILGTISGIYAANSALGVTNSGTIHGNQYGIYGDATITLTNNVGGDISGNTVGLQLFKNGNVITNNGTISGAKGISANGTISLTNNLGGTITGTSAAFQLTGTGAGSITNAGNLINGVVSTGGGNLTIDNAASGNIVRVAVGSAIDMSNGGKLTLTNAGDIVGSAWGVVGRNAGDSIVNSGRIASGTISGETITVGGSDAIQLASGGTVTNLSGGRITGGNNGVVGGAIVLDNRAGALISGAKAVSIGGSSSVTNAGTITGGTASGNIGVSVSTGSTVTNLTGGTITGERAVQFNGTNAALTNSGSISSTAVTASQGLGALFFNGGTVNNLAGGSITGSARGIEIQGGVGSVTNAGMIQGGSIFAIGLSNGGSVTNQASGTISSTNGQGVYIGGGVAGGNQITNYGTINAGSFAVSIFNGGTIDNYGSVTAGATGNALSLVGSGTITNHAGGTLTANQASDAWGILGQGGIQTIVNDGTINAGSGIVTSTTGATIANSGSVTGQLYGAWAQSGQIALTNSGTFTGGTNAVLSAAGGTVTNSGILRSTGGDAVSFGAAATLTNQSGGVIDGTNFGINAGGALTLTNAGSIEGDNSGLYLGGASTVDNSGSIVGKGISGANGDGISAASTLNLTNSGSISGGVNAGVVAYAGGLTLDNKASGSITGGSSVFGIAVNSQGTLNLTNAGVLSAGSGTTTAVQANGNALIDLLAGSTVNGDIVQVGSGTTSVAVAGAVAGRILSTDAAVDTITLASTGNLGGASLSAGDDSLTINGGTLSGLVDAGSGTDALTFDMAGNGSFDAGYFAGFESRAKTGAGTLTLTGVDGMTIDFAVNGGTLALSGGSAINDAAAVTLASGTTLALNNSETIRALSGGGSVSLGANALTLGGNDSTAYSGVMSGTGGLTKNGTGTLTLSGSNAFTGTLLVSGGSVVLGASNVLADTSAVAVASGASLNLGANSDTVGRVALAGSLNGTGTLTAAQVYLLGGTVNANLGTGQLLQDSGVSTLNGTSAASLVNVYGGTLRLGASERIANSAALNVNASGIFDLAGFTETVGALTGNGSITLGAGRLIVDQATTTAFDGSISGTGGLTKSGSGMLTLTGANSYTGSTLVNGGKLAVNGSLASTVTINSGSTLSGTGRVGGLIVNAGGILAPGSASTVQTGSGVRLMLLPPPASTIGTVTVAGNATFNAGSFYDVDINPTMSDMTVVTGTTTINGGTVRVNAADATYNPLTIYSIIQSAGGVTGTFASVTDNLAYLDTRLSYTSNQVLLEARRNDIRFADVATNPNQSGVADAVQSIGSGRLYDLVLVQSAAGANQAFNALSGEIYSATPTALLEDSRHVRNAMLNADDGREGFGFWAEGMRSNGHIEAMSSRGTAELDHDRDQLAGGITFGKGSVSFGAMAGRASTDLDLDARLSSAKVKSTFVGGQLGYRAGPMTVRGGAAYAWHDISTDRSVVFPGLAEAEASSQDGRTMQLWGDAGIDLADSADVLEPFVGFAIVDSKVDGTRENGGIAALRVGSTDQTAEFARLGLRLKGSTTLPGTSAVVSPRMAVALQRGWGDLDARVTSSFAGSSPFTLNGSRLSRTSVQLEGGVDIDVGAARFGLRYDGSLAERQVDHSAKATVSFRF